MRVTKVNEEDAPMAKTITKAAIIAHLAKKAGLSKKQVMTVLATRVCPDLKWC